MVLNQPALSRSSDAQTSALAIIRSATSHCHSDLEKCIDWATSFSSPARYVDLLRRFYRVVEPLESRLARLENYFPTESPSFRTQSLQHDMEAVARFHPIAVMDPREDDFAFDSSLIVDQTTAWGVRYVLEGSALGGQLLSKQLQTHRAAWAESLPHESQALEADSVIDSYFVGRGANTGLCWRDFCQQLNSQLRDDRAASLAAQAAVKTFSSFHSSLVGKAVCVRP